MFSSFDMKLKDNVFEELAKSAKFEKLGKGRQGTVLYHNNNNIIPIVRTTTKYNTISQKFIDIHYDIINNILKTTNMNMYFNNALIEMYDKNYTTMGFHSDQALDLDPDSYICLFSCYNNIETKDIRSLKIKNKSTDELSEIKLTHNSIVLFSVNTNSKNLHKIVLDKITSDDIWIGLTFRLSKTFIQFINEIPYFYKTNRILKLANEEETKEFYTLRQKENKSIVFEYPELNYTISMSDMDTGSSVFRIEDVVFSMV
jgi:hypothetical protein